MPLPPLCLQMVELLGPIPAAMACQGVKAADFFGEEGQWRRAEVRPLNPVPLSRLFQDKYGLPTDEVGGCSAGAGRRRVQWNPMHMA